MCYFGRMSVDRQAATAQETARPAAKLHDYTERLSVDAAARTVGSKLRQPWMGAILSYLWRARYNPILACERFRHHASCAALLCVPVRGGLI